MASALRYALFSAKVIFMRVVITTILFLIAGLVTAFADDDHIVTRSVFEDKSGTLSIGEVVSQPFQPADLVLSAGYSPSVHWLRLTVRPRADGDPLVLWIRPTFLDEVTLYEPDALASGGWARRVTGDRVPFPKGIGPEPVWDFQSGHPRRRRLITCG